MSAPYRLTPRARDGLERSVSYVERRFGLEVADRVLSGLERAFERLATSPGVGHRREDLTADEHVLFWPVGPTLIAYRSSAVLEILFVERGEIDWERLLEGGLE